MGEYLGSSRRGFYKEEAGLCYGSGLGKATALFISSDNEISTFDMLESTGYKTVNKTLLHNMYEYLCERVLCS